MTTEPLVADIPQMGYGTWNRPADEAYHGVIWALEAGCRHIDTGQTATAAPRESMHGN